MIHASLHDVREEFAGLYEEGSFVVDKSGVKVLEIVGSSFVVPENLTEDEKTIFGRANHEYIARELQWYRSQSLNVEDIPGKVPEIWRQVADRDGFINSNYGYLIWSQDNYSQYANALEELKKNPQSRRAIMIYTRPIMHYDYNRNGRSDFVCTSSVQYLVRNGYDVETATNRPVLTAVVNMRSNDVRFGFLNDYWWQRYVLGRLAADLDLPVGDIVWQTGSLHVYQRHFYLVKYYIDTGETSVGLEDFKKEHPDYEYL